MILPHELLPWLVRNNAFPDVEGDVPVYWETERRWRDIPGEIDPSKHHPLYIWGDDCQYNEQYEKLICVVLGHALDPRSFSIECCWPLFCLREATFMD